VVLDATSGTVLFEKDAHTKRAPASMTKIMTLVLALEDVNAGVVSLLDEAAASENAWEMGGTEVWAEPGESMPLDEWLKAVAVGSANDGAVIVAEFISGTEANFVERMNARARELGMTDTNFKNSHGLDEEGHYTTAMDMAILSRHAVTVPHLLDYTRIYQTPFRGGKNELTNFNKLVYLYEGADGLKTGMTSQSGYCLSATAQRGDSRFIVVVMGAETPDQRLNDAWRLLDWCFANFKTVRVVGAQPVCQARVYKGKHDVVDVITPEPYAVTVLKQRPGEVKRIIKLEKVTAPVKEGEPVGEMVVEIDGETVASLPLVARSEVERAGFMDYVKKYLRSFMVGR
jgi:D-alanyl-D-alanine carboxypeptidase (penicillin-binding protein 5/6)